MADLGRIVRIHENVPAETPLPIAVPREEPVPA